MDAEIEKKLGEILLDVDDEGSKYPYNEAIKAIADLVEKWKE